MRDRESMRDLQSRQTFQDKTLHCCDCGESFVWTAGEQRYYYDRGLTEPKRCKSCRELRKRTVYHPDADLDSILARAREEIKRSKLGDNNG